MLIVLNTVEEARERAIGAIDQQCSMLDGEPIATRSPGKACGNPTT